MTVKVKVILENKGLTKTQYVGPSNKPGGVGDCYVNGYFTDGHCTMGNKHSRSFSFFALALVIAEGRS